VFGIGTELREAEWRAVVRQLLAQGLLGVEGDYGTLVLTADSAEVLRRRREVRLRREPERARRGSATKGGAQGTGGVAGGAAAGAGGSSRRAAAAADLPEEAAPLFEKLRAWRAATAKEEGKPAYVIFHDATLREIATVRPSSLAELSHVSGVGESKLTKYGDQVLAVLAAETSEPASQLPLESPAASRSPLQGPETAS
jgi:ATP-dependent DNA helicase RecQ